MRMKCGNQWFETAPNYPIMVILTDADKKYIADMPPDAHKYAMFDNADMLSITEGEMHEWMNE